MTSGLRPRASGIYVNADQQAGILIVWEKLLKNCERYIYLFLVPHRNTVIFSRLQILGHLELKEDDHRMHNSE